MIMKWKRLSLLAAGFLLSGGLSAFAAMPLTVNVNESKYMEEPGLTRIAVGNPEIADVRTLSGHDFLLVGKKTGTTTLIVWSSAGRQEYNVNVSANDQGTAQSIQTAIGLPDVKAEMMNGKVLLRGKVENQREHDEAVKIAELYLGKGGGKVAYMPSRGRLGDGGSSTTTSSSSSSGSGASASGSSDGDGIGMETNEDVIDMLQIAHMTQVRLEAQLIEINTSAERNLGIQYWSPQLGSSSSSGSGDSPDGLDFDRGSAGLFYTGENVSHPRGSFGWIGDHTAGINASLQALVTEGKARILSRPSITTMSGERADILIGGRIPVPTSNGTGGIGIDWHDYGIRLNIEPVVDPDGKVTSKVHAEVSTLDYGNGVRENDFTIPAIATREAEAVINVRSGMTMAIGGLLNSQDSKTVTKVPFLGDLPIIGAFFRHTQKTRDNRELLILITPTVVTDDMPQPMSQRLKRNYELSERAARNRENVNLNAPVEQGTEAEETDLFGEKPPAAKTVIVEEKEPADTGTTHLLRTKDAKGQTVLVPLTEEDYAKRKDNLTVVDVEEKNVPKGAEPIPVKQAEAAAPAEEPEPSAPAESAEQQAERARILARLRKVMDAYPDAPVPPPAPAGTLPGGQR